MLVKNLDTGAERTVESNDVDYYVVPALPAGRYSINITAPGFQTQTVSELTLAVDQNATVNISLKVGAVSEAVNVVGDAAIVDTRTATLNTVHQPETNRGLAAQRAQRSPTDTVDPRDSGRSGQF